MICNENTKINGKRLIAAVAVVAVMICALAIVLPAGNVSAADEYGSIEVPIGDDVCTIDASNAASFDWSTIATDDYTAYVISTTVTFEEGETVTFSEPVYIVDGGSLTLDGTGSKVIDAPVYLKSGAKLVLTSSALEVTENCEIQVEAGATINVNGLNGKVDSDIIGTSESQTAMVALTEGMATVSDFDMLLGAVPTGFTVDLDGVADLKKTNIEGISAPVFQEKTALNIGEGSKLTVSGTDLTSAATINNNGTVTVSGSITNTGSIVNNGAVTVSGTVTSVDGTITNNGTVSISGTITGTIDNCGEVVIEAGQQSSSPNVKGLTVRGGELTPASTDNMPVIENLERLNLTVGNNQISYMTYVYPVANVGSILIGIPEVVYTGTDYSGMPVSVVAISYTTGNNAPVYIVDDDNWGAYDNSNFIYDSEENAKLGNTDYGSIENVGTYYVNVGLYVTIGGGYGTIPVRMIAELDMQPQKLTDVTIAGPAGYDEDIGNRTWIGQDEEVTLAYGKDVQLYVGTEKSDLRCGTEAEVKAGTADFYLSYEDNTEVGTATVTAVFSNNYAVTPYPVTNTFEIVQGLTSLDVTLNDDTTLYVGQIVDTKYFHFVGVYANGDTTDETPESDDIVVGNVDITTVNGVAYTDGMAFPATDDGKVAIEFEYTVDGQDEPVPGSVTVDVVAIESIDAENMSDEKESTNKYTTVYDIGQSFDPNGMRVTVIYVDGAFVVFENTKETGEDPDTGFVINNDPAADGETKLTADMSNEITFSPEKLEILGEQIVTGDYFGKTFEIGVTVGVGDGKYGIVYMAADRTTQLAVQVGAAPTEDGVVTIASVYNYVWELATGESFNGWFVEDTSVKYYPGQTIGYGENKEMWDINDTPYLLYLYADIVDTNEYSKVTVNAGEGVTVALMDGDAEVVNGASVLVGSQLEITVVTDAVIPEGSRLVVTVNSIELEAQDGKYLYTATAESTIIEASIQEIVAPTPELSIIGSGFYADADAAKAAILAISGIPATDAIANTAFVAFNVAVPGQTMTGTVTDPEGNVIYTEDMTKIAGTEGKKLWYFSFDDQLRNYEFVSGLYTLTVTIDDVSVTEKIYIDATPVQPVPEVTLKDIIVDAQTQYEAGQSFQVDAVYAVYSDGSVVDVTDDVDYSTELPAAGPTEVEISYGGITKVVAVTVTEAETEPVATEVKIFISPYDQGFEVLLYGVDGSVPAGATVTVTYTYQVYVPELDRYFADTFTVPGQVVQNEDGSIAVLLDFDLSADPNYATISGAYATVTIDGQTPMNSYSVAFKPVSTGGQ